MWAHKLITQGVCSTLLRYESIAACTRPCQHLPTGARRQLFSWFVQKPDQLIICAIKRSLLDKQAARDKNSLLPQNYSGEWSFWAWAARARLPFTGISCLFSANVSDGYKIISSTIVMSNDAQTVRDAIVGTCLHLKSRSHEWRYIFSDHRQAETLSQIAFLTRRLCTMKWVVAWQWKKNTACHW